MLTSLPFLLVGTELLRYEAPQSTERAKISQSSPVTCHELDISVRSQKLA